MIDTRTEQLVTLSQLVKRLPVRRRQRPVHPATAHRWRHPGIRGIKLECIRIGGAWHTSMEAFQRFCEQLTNDAGADIPVVGKGSTPHVDLSNDDRHQRQIEQELNDLGA